MSQIRFSMNSVLIVKRGRREWRFPAQLPVSPCLVPIPALLLPVEPWAVLLSSDFSFLICKMGIIVIPTCVVWWLCKGNGALTAGRGPGPHGKCSINAGRGVLVSVPPAQQVSGEDPGSPRSRCSGKGLLKTDGSPWVIPGQQQRQWGRC